METKECQCKCSETTVNSTPSLSVLSDGRRTKENVITVVHADGTKETTKERLEEVIPMRVVQRVRHKFSQVPVEESVETINDDGTMQTTVRRINQDNLDLNRKPTTLEDIASEVKVLRDVLQSGAGEAPKNASFLSAAKAKFSSQCKWAEAADTTTTTTTTNTDAPLGVWGDLNVSTVLWIIVAVIGGLVAYAMF